MTRLYNDPTAFADEMIAGFVAANRRYVRQVPGGVIRSAKTDPGSVAVVIGGGSGHYPAFGGLVGQGLAAGAAMGNLFASPSTQQAHSVAAAADAGGGVMFSYGNYAGDCLNFDAAQDQLRAEGIRCETVVVTDDVASAPIAEKQKRRGIAGDLTVFKAAAAAADAGLPLDEVVRVARFANERTRSFGVAFSGCTLPGADEPLFSVPEGRMAIGLGIHGEPGISETDIPTADELAEQFVSTLLGDLPEGIDSPAGQRVVPILNGLGSVKYEELFVVYGRIAVLLEEAGIQIVDPQVGEFCTSFDMAGASLTLFWVDEELERFWEAPTDTPAFRKGSVERAEQLDDSELAAAVADEISEGSDESRGDAATAFSAIEALTTMLDEHVDELGHMDAVAGDGDHGIGMQRGARAARTAAQDALERGAGVGTLLTRAADAWSDRAGGTSGALWGVILRAVATSLGDADAVTPAALAAGVTAASDGIRSYGKAEVGDKTMVDAIVPFADTLAAEYAGGATLAAGWATAADAATAAAAASADLAPKMGRARNHTEKSIGTPDPGAHSFALIVQTVAGVLAGAGSSATTTEGDTK